MPTLATVLHHGISLKKFAISLATPNCIQRVLYSVTLIRLEQTQIQNGENKLTLIN